MLGAPNQRLQCRLGEVAPTMAPSGPAKEGASHKMVMKNAQKITEQRWGQTRDLY